MKARKPHTSWYRQRWLIIVLMLIVLIGPSVLFALYLRERRSPTPCTVNDITTHKNLSYATRPGFEPQATSLDLYLPEHQGDCPHPSPLVIWIHGGSFAGGDKALGIEYKKQLFTNEGWAFASIGYRLTSPERPIMHPAQAEDVAAAIGWLRENRQQYNLDTESIMLVGYSAGAYLAALISADNEYVLAEKFPPDNIICTVTLDTGAYDLPRYMQSDDGAVSVYRDVLGHDENSWRQYSPLHRATSAEHLPDFLLVTRGDGIRPVITRSFSEILMQRGVKTQVLEADDYTHGELDGLLGVPGDTLLTSEVMSFLRNCIDR